MRSNRRSFFALLLLLLSLLFMLQPHSSYVTLAQSEATAPVPEEQVTDLPPEIPTEVPTEIPTDPPTAIPTDIPTAIPTELPTDIPTDIPTEIPPTDVPTDEATLTVPPLPTVVPQPTQSTPGGDGSNLNAGRPDAPEVVEPKNNKLLTIRRPTFVWESANGAVRYYLELYNQDPFSVAPGTLRYTSPRVTATSFQLPSDEALPDGTYYWQVLGVNASGVVGLPSVMRHFYINSPSPVYGPPVAAVDSYAVAEGRTLTVVVPGVLGNDTVNGSTVSAVNGSPVLVGTATTTTGGGTLTVNANGRFVYTPMVGFLGTDSFTYTITNPLGSSTATVTIEVKLAPIAENDSFEVLTGVTFNGDLNDDNGSGADVLGDPLGNVARYGGGSLGGTVNTYRTPSTQALAGGELTVNRDGTFSLVGVTTPGTYTFRYRLRNALASDLATVTLIVSQAPRARNDGTYLVAVGGTLNIPKSAPNDLLDNDRLGDPAGTITQFGGGSLGGTVDDNLAGTTVALAGGSLTVNPNGSFNLTNPTVNGFYTFQYRLANAGASSIATVTINVRQGPAAVDDGPYGMNVSTTLTITTADANDLLDNDSLGSPAATITQFGGGSLGGAVNDNTAGASVALAGGTLTVNADGSFTLANPSIIGVYTFQYRLKNLIGSSVATVTLDVRNAPDAKDDSLVAVVGTTLSGDLNDNNGSGADIMGVPAGTITEISGGSLIGGPFTTPSSQPFAGGTLTVNADGTFSLSGATSTGTFTFNYTLLNTAGSDTALVTIEVRRAPTAQDDGFNVDVSTTLSGDLNDDNRNGADDLGVPAATLTSFGGGDLGGTVTSNVAGASVSLAGGTLTVNADGSFSLVNPTITGPVSFDYRLTNSAGTSDGTVTITVRRVPTAQDDSFIAIVGTTLNGDLNDDNGSGADDLGIPTANITSFGGGSLGGAVTDQPAGMSVTFAGGTLTVNGDGTFSLTGQTTTGTATFQYRLINAAGTDDATVTIEVRRAPTAQDDAFNVDVSTTLSGDLNNDNGNGADDLGVPAATLTTFGGGDLGDIVISNPAGTSVSFMGGTLTVNADGSFSLVNPTITGVVSFDYQLTNSAGTSDGTVTITVRRPPTAQDDSFIAVVGTALNGDLKNANGSGFDDLGIPTATVTQISGGSLVGGPFTTPASEAFAGGTLTVNADGTFSLSGHTGTGTFTFVYTLTNGAGSDTATVTIEVRRLPDAKDDTYTGSSAAIVGVGFSSDLVDNDNGSGADDRGVPAATLTTFGGGDLGGDVTTYPAGTLVSFAGGTIHLLGNGLFDLADMTTAGTYTFQYRLTNSAGTDDATVTIEVRRGPDAKNDSFVAVVGTPLTGDLNNNNGNGADDLGQPAGAIDSYGAGSLGGSVSDHAAGTSTALAGGTLTVNADGTFSLTGFTTTGTFTFDYHLINAAFGDIATVTIEVRRAPDAIDDAFSVNVSETLAGELDLNDDPGVPAATLTSFGSGDLGGTVTTNAAGASVTFLGGTLTVNADGTFSLVNPTTTGIFSFDYQLTNSAGTSDGTVTISVRRAPTAQDDSFIAIVGSGLNGDLNNSNGSSADDLGVPAATVTSFGGGALGGTVTTNAAGASVSFAGGTLTVNGDGTFSLTGHTTTGTATFQYRLTNAVTSDDATVTIEVRRTPDAIDDAFSVNVSTTLSEDVDFNDDLGVPAATLTSFGGGDLGGTVISNTAGSNVSLAGGTLTVNADGTFSLVNPTITGVVSFDYRLTNSAGTSDGTVTITVRRAPTAQDDSFIALVGTTLSGDLNSNNGSGADDLGIPAGTVTQISSGSLVGGPFTTPASQPFAGGTLTVNADGTFSLSGHTGTGPFTFVYTLANAAGSDTATVTIDIRRAPDAINDAFNINVGATLSGDLNNSNGSGADDLGVPAATLTSFGGGTLGGTVTTNTAGASVALAGGTLTVNSDGTFSLVAPTATGSYTFDYRLANLVGTNDATVTINVSDTPDAIDDTLAVVVSTTLNADVNDDNGNGADNLGVPAATLTSFGGGSLGGTVTTNAAGASVALAGGTLTVNSNGTLSLVNPTAPGVYTFLYRLTNASGTDDATVTITVQQAPDALNDAYNLQPNNALLGDLNGDNGSGADVMGVPAATLTSFGGGDISGMVDDQAAGSSTFFADGILTVNADGTFSIVNVTVPGTYTFQYRLQNVVGSDVATVTILVATPPVAQNDALATNVSVTLNGNVNSNNGSGADSLGIPAATLTSFGGGSLGGSVTTNAAGASVALAGGTLTLNSNGTLTLTTPTLSGDYTFSYRLTNVAGTSDATVSIQVRVAPNAQDDFYSVMVGNALNSDVNANNGGGADTLGFPAATLTSFGGGSLGGSVTTNTADASLALAGGTLTVSSDGTISLTGTTTPGTYTFLYRLTNAAATDDATVSISVLQAPDAVDDGTYTVLTGSTLTVLTTASNDLLDNDTLGFPVATITKFGGGSLGGTVDTNNAGASVALAGGTLQVNANGSFTLTTPTTPGSYTFQYRLSNAAGSDTATVTIEVQQAPNAQNDLFNAGFTAGLDRTGDLNNDNGSGADVLGVPTATLTGFGGGSLGGTVDTNSAGATVALGGGTLTVNADGTFTLDNVTTPATYTFDYRLTNAAGTDTATVTIIIDAAPSVVSTTPANGATNVLFGANITIDFSETVVVAAGGVTLVCDSTPVAFTPTLPTASVDPLVIDPTPLLPGNASCVVTVVAANVSDSDTNDLPNNMTADYVFSFQVQPEAVDDSYTVTPHLTFSSTAFGSSVRNNDEPFNATITGYGPTLAAANGTVPNGVTSVTPGGAGGRVIMQSSGDFFYYPEAGDTNTSATFFYTVTGGDTAQVTLTLENEQLVWFVDSTPPAAPTGISCAAPLLGTQACPEDTLADVAAVDTTSDTIYIASGTYACGITLEASEIVVGDGSTSTLAAISGVSPVSGSQFAAFSGTAPTLTTVAGNCFTLSTNNTVRGVTIGDTGGYGFASAANIGTATVTETSDGGTGGLFDLGGGGTFNASFGSLNVTSTTTSNVINLTNINGAISHTTASSISHGQTGTTINVSGGAVTLTYNGPITKTASGRVIDISSTTGAFSFGAITQNVAGGTGVNLSSANGNMTFSSLTLGSSGTRVTSGVTITNGNTGLTYALGPVSIFTSSGAGISATNFDGILTATGAVDAVGSALSIDGPAGVTTLNLAFSKLTSSNSGTTGISLVDVGGTVTVSGGATPQTNIQNPTGVGINIQNSSAVVNFSNTTVTGSGGTGVMLRTSTAGITFGDLDVTPDSGQQGMYVTGNTGTVTTTAGSTISTIGNAAAVILGCTANQPTVTCASSTPKSPLNLTFTSISVNLGQASPPGTTNGLIVRNTTGTITVTGDGSATRNASGGTVQTTTGNIVILSEVGTVSFTSMLFKGAGDDAINYTASSGTTTALSVIASQFESNFADHFQSQPTGSANMTVILSRNDFVGNHPTGLGESITLTPFNISGTYTFHILNNTISGSTATAITIDSGTLQSEAVMQGNVAGNTIGTSGTALSCSAQGNGINVEHHGAGAYNVTITNNIIRRCFDRGILAAANAGTGRFSLTVTGNNIGEMVDTTSTREAFHLHAGSSDPTGDFNMICLALGDALLTNSALKNTFDGYTSSDDLRIRHRAGSVDVFLPGYLGAPLDTAAVQAYLSARNTASVVSVTSAAASPNGFHNMTGGTLCPTPPLAPSPIP